jgi:hypothetical protein
MNILKYNRILILWICINIVLFTALNKEKYSIKIGPNNDLIFMGIYINTKSKYFLFFFYIIIKTIMVNINNQILHPWIILNIQNKNPLILNKIHCYEIVIFSNLYGWFDWFCNLKLFFLQIDVILFSLFMDLLSNTIVTKYYLKQKIIINDDIELSNLI